MKGTGYPTSSAYDPGNVLSLSIIFPTYESLGNPIFNFLGHIKYTFMK